MASTNLLDFSESEKVLSLCIPTYNRAACLRQQFLRMLSLSQEQLDCMEILISDNCSTDDTEKIVRQFQDKIPLIYIRNEENVGPDSNFLQCINKATGKYVWLLGDDDYFLTTHLTELLSLLSNRSFGLVHIGAPAKGKFYQAYDDTDSFLSSVGVMITFISANIFRRDLVVRGDFSKYRGTNLLQVPIYFTAVFRSADNAILHRRFYNPATVATANGGYNLIRVFGKNFSDILDEYEEKSLSPHTAMMMRNHACDFIFPFVLNYLILRRKNNFDTKGSWKLLDQCFGYPRLLLSAFHFFSSPRQIRRFAVKFLKFLKNCFTMFVTLLSMVVYPFYLARRFTLLKNAVISNRFRCITKSRYKCFIQGPIYYSGPQYMKIGKHFCSCPGLRIECFKAGDKNPVLKIGDGVSLSYNVHIGAIDSITIGNRVLMGSNILITDHSHGRTDHDSMETPPSNRPLYSKGPVIIEDDVWICENVSVLPNVRIGHNSIIGANTVITKDVPPFSRVVGNPARCV